MKKIISLLCAFPFLAMSSNKMIVNIENQLNKFDIIKVYVEYKTSGKLGCGEFDMASFVPKREFVDYQIENGQVIIDKKFSKLCKYKMSEIIVSTRNPHGHATDYANIPVANGFITNDKYFEGDERKKSFAFNCLDTKADYGCDSLGITSIEFDEIDVFLGTRI
jgi:hypothetical protein